MSNPSPAQNIELHLLGRFEVRVGEAVAIDGSWRAAKAKALLKLLALAPNRSLHREQALDALWPDLEPQAASANLRQALHQLRSTLLEAHVDGALIERRDDLLALAPNVSVDVDTFRRAARRARELGDARLYEEALSVYGGELLPEDRYEEWTIGQRDALGALHQDVLLESAGVLEDAGDFDAAGDRLRQLIALEAANEAAHRSLIVLFARAGQRDRALRQYQTLRDALERGMGVAPSEETEALRRSILEGRPPPARKPRITPPDPYFVGRVDEMKSMRAAVDEALRGEGRIVLLSGEPGIGKTRAAGELAAYASLRGADVLWGRCFSDEGAPPYWPWVQSLRSYVRRCEADELAGQLGPHAAAIAQVVADVRDVIPGVGDPPSMDPSEARFRLFDSVTQFLKSAASKQPLVLFLDDLHWADRSSILLLQFLARELRSARLLVVALFRDRDLAVDHPLQTALGELAREQNAVRISLGALSKEEVGRYVELVSKSTPGERLIAGVWEQTKGNALFVREMVRLLDHGKLPDREDMPEAWKPDVPPTVRDVIGLRLDALPECRELLTVAAVIGMEFNVALLSEVSGLTRATVLERLDSATDAQLVELTPDGVGAYRFSHALVQRTLYETLAQSKRVALHRQVGEAIERLYGGRLEAQLPQLAHHFGEAALGGSAEQGVEYAERAGVQASATLGYEEGARLFERAYDLLQLSAPGDAGRLCELLIARGDALTKAGLSSQGKVLYRDACELARQSRHHEAFSRSALGFAGSWVGAGFGGEDIVQLLREALELQTSEDSALRARLMARLAVEIYYSAHSNERVSLGDQAVEIASRAGDATTLAYALNAKYYAHWTPGSARERLDIATEMVSVAKDAGDIELALQGRNFRILGLLEQPDIAAAERELDEVSTLAEQLRQPLFRYRVASRRAMLALMQGRFAEAERMTMEANAISQRAEDANAAQQFAAQMMALRREQGRLEELEAPAKAFVEQYSALPGWRCALAYLYSELDRPDDARANLEMLAEDDFGVLPLDANWTASLTLLADACAWLGDAPRARVLYDLLAPFEKEHVVIAAGAVSQGCSSHYLGLLATTLSRWEDAERHFDDGLEMHTALGARPSVARTLFAKAKMLLGAADPARRDEALELLGESLSTARKLGMVTLTKRAEGLKPRGKNASRKGASLRARPD